MGKRKDRKNIFSTPLANRILEIAARVSNLEQKASKIKDPTAHAKLLIDVHTHLSNFSNEIENLFTHKVNDQ